MSRKKKIEVKENIEEISREIKGDSKNYAKQTKGVVLVMGLVLIMAVSTYFIIQGNKTVTYHNIKFSKENQGGIMHYKSLLGYVTATGENIPFVLQLRSNPKELDKIPIDANIRLLDEAIISLSPEVIDCNDTYPTLIDLSMTLKTFGTPSTGATIDEEFAEKENVPLIDCKNSSDKMVIIFQEGDKTRIKQDADFENCYIIEVNNCEMRPSYERFILHFIENSMIKKNE